MLNVSEQCEIGLTRGDTARLTIAIKNDLNNEPYEMQENDTLTFSVKKSITSSEYAFQKRVTGSNVFHFEPQDTAGLSFGKYKYDVQLTTEAGEVYTVIPPTVFEVLQEVT